MIRQSTFLVLGATGRTGGHVVARALAEGHRVRALVRTPAKLALRSERLDVRPGSITDAIDLDALVAGVDFIVAMLGDPDAQRTAHVNADFMRRLVPAMRRQGVKRLLYQAGALSRPYGGHLSPILWTIRHTLARRFMGQHEDNDAVMRYLATEANDVEWIVHRAAIGSDGPVRGFLRRSGSGFSVATHRDCADYNYRTVTDPAAVRTADFSQYAES